MAYGRAAPQGVGSAVKLGTKAFPKRPQLFGIDIPAEEWDELSLDLDRTHARVTRMLRDEMLSSYKPGAFDELVRRFTCFPSDGQDAMVVEGPIAFHSTCAHHVLPFSGEAFIGYVPGMRVIGASKIPRVLEYYSRMLQIQERLARQVADFLHDAAEAKMVIVLLEGTHSCMGVRGVRQANTRMVTAAVRPQPGDEEDSLLRGVLNEFYSTVQLLRK